MNISFGTYYLSPIQVKDAWNICNFVVANESRLKAYFPKTLEQNLTPDLAKYFTKKKTKQFELNEEFLYTIKESQNNDLVGLVYLKELDWNKKRGEFAYAIGYQFEGKGITTEAVKALSNHAFETLGLKTLEIFVYKDNLSSVYVAKKCGFIWLATIENKFKPKGREPIDMELYELHNER
ncbi:GNAT family N-acetyltransferase [Flavobacteriaceae sp. LMIT009]